ncbi:MAG: ABC transporter substrate-binding protein [Coriobacteriia bacterium]|nr:ABC transporter substrate-binding protein [Coriobacteriia bacterium]
MKLKTILLSTLLAAVCIVCVACTSNTNKIDINKDGIELLNTDELKIAIASDNPPFEYFKSVEPTGFDVELSKQIANDLGLYLSYQNMEFNNVIKTVEEHKADIAISAIAINADRASRVNFSSAYYEDVKVLVDKKGNEITPQNIDKFLEIPNKKLVVQAGTTCEEYAKANYSKLQIITKITNDECFKAIKDEDADLFLINQAYANSKLGDDFEIVKNTGSKEAYAVAINKQCPKLTKAISEIIEARIKDGTINKIKDSF